MSARIFVLLVVMGGAVVATLACRQILGVSDLQVDAGAAGSDGGRETTFTGCNISGTTFDQCYTCCSSLDGGDPSFYTGGLLQCACGQATGCLADCPIYCDSGGGNDKPPNCDICVFDSFATPDAACAPAAMQAGAQGGAALIYQCALQCPAPTQSDCARLRTLTECHDCCASCAGCSDPTACMQSCAQDE